MHSRQQERLQEPTVCLWEFPPVQHCTQQQNLPNVRKMRAKISWYCSRIPVRDIFLLPYLLYKGRGFYAEKKTQNIVHGAYRGNDSRNGGRTWRLWEKERRWADDHQRFLRSDERILRKIQCVIWTILRKKFREKSAGDTVARRFRKPGKIRRGRM